MDNSTTGRQWSWDVLRKSQISFSYLEISLRCKHWTWGATGIHQHLHLRFKNRFTANHLPTSGHFWFNESLSSLSSLSSEAPGNPRESKGIQGTPRRCDVMKFKLPKMWKMLLNNTNVTGSTPIFPKSKQKSGSKSRGLRLPVRHGTTVVRSPTRKWRARTRRVGTSPKKSSSMLWVQHIHVLNRWRLSLKRLLPASQKCWSIPTQHLPLASGPERSKGHNGEHPTNKTKKRMQRATTPKDFFKKS